MSLLDLSFIVFAEEEMHDGDFLGLTGTAYGLAVAKEILPERGRYEGANYRVSLTFTESKQGVKSQIGSATAIHEFPAEVNSGTLQFKEESKMQGYTSLQVFRETTGSPAVDWEPTDCFVTMQLDYDPGMTCSPSRLERDSNSDPDLGYVTELSADIRVDYRGRVTGTTIEQRCPRAIKYCLQVGELAVLLLDPDTEGVPNPTFQYEEGENLLAIDSSGEIAWISDSPTDENRTRYFYTALWRVGQHLLAKAYLVNGSGRMTVRLNPKTGEILATDI